MSNLYNYNPIPPRVWSRVQNKCTYLDSSNNDYNGSVFVPISLTNNQVITLAQANQESKQIQKGNILQYKGNSAQLTKKQKYAQLAKGFGPNRTKVFATQSQTYTNPNTTGLVRVNSVEIPFPNTLVGKPNNISGPFQYAVPNPNGCLNANGSPSTSLQDGGSLVCGTYADPCSGEIIKSGATSATICNPASASNVPGSSVLCWNKNVQTWFPRQRYTMTNSGTKWPQGYKGLVSAVTTLKVLSILSASIVPNDNTRITLNWMGGKNYCSTNWELYQNGVFLNSYDIETATITGLVPGTTNTYYVICQNSCGIVAQSNSVTVSPINDIVQQTVAESYTYILQPGSLYYNNVTVIAGGGGGGGGPFMGTENASGKIGGSGGGGGGITHINTNVSITTQTTLTYIVGSGGSGGTLSSGTAGNTSSFTDVVASINLNAAGGGPGLYDGTLFPDGDTTVSLGGAGGAGSGGDINGTGGVGGNSGGVGLPTNNNTGFIPPSTPGGVSTTANGPGGGGGGGCIYRTASGGGGSGGIYFFSNGANGGNGGDGAVGGIAGSISGPVIVGNGSGTIGFGGSGGGGVGGNSFSGSGTQTQTGGHGLYGSGGGGSGACHTADKVGVGGNGGSGFVGFTVYRMIIDPISAIAYIQAPEQISPITPTVEETVPSSVTYTVPNIDPEPDPITNIRPFNITNADSGKMYIINDTTNVENSIHLENYMTEKDPVVTIHNNTGKLLTINSSDLVYNNLYSPDGTTSTQLDTMSSARIHNIFYSAENKNLKKAVIF